MTNGIREILEWDRDKYTPKYACNALESKTEWIYVGKIGGMKHYRCKNCIDDGNETLANENDVKWWRFCPRCGAKMN